MLKMYLHTENELSRSRLSTVRTLQTDRQTDRQTDIKNTDKRDSQTAGLMQLKILPLLCSGNQQYKQNDNLIICMPLWLLITEF